MIKWEAIFFLLFTAAMIGGFIYLAIKLFKATRKK